MEELRARILAEGQVLGGGILKVDSLINHQLDPALMQAIGQEVARRFADAQVTRILTAEVSGIAPALMAGLALGVPVVFARKKRPITMQPPIYTAHAPSRTKKQPVELSVSAEYLNPGDRVLIVDDFLATGQTLMALARIVEQSGADLVGIAAVIEKAFEQGRAHLAPLGVPIEAMAVITRMSDGHIEVEG